MQHKPHEVPLPRGPRNYQPPVPKPRVSLAALQWAADRAEMSYGQFSQRLKREDETRIQEEFEAYKREREAAAVARRAQPVDNELPDNDEFIITDEDV